MSYPSDACQNNRSATGAGSCGETEAELSFDAKLTAEIDRRMAATPAMLHSINEMGLLVSVSDAWLEKLGYERSEVLGRPSTDFLTPDSRQLAISTVLPEFFHFGRCENVHYQMSKKNGDVFDVLMSAVLADDYSGRGRHSLAVITDISHLLEATNRLAESEARYRSLVEDQSDLVSLAKPSGELCYVNSAYAAHYGRRADDMIGKNLLDFIPVSERARVAGLFAHICDLREKVESENRVILPTGESRWFAWTNRALADTEGKVRVVHSVGRDIQDRVDAESRLLASEARYRFLAEHSTDMILLVDQLGKRIYVSPASRKLLGFDPEEMINLRLQDTIHPHDALRVLPILRANPTDTLLTYRMRHKDGSYVWVETTGKTVEISTGKRQRLIIVRDVSARKRAEEQLAEAHARLKVLSTQDGLTELSNRRTFEAKLTKEYQHARSELHSLALIMIDVDRFKAFNDYYGHPAGDECLRRIAKAISGSALRRGDLAARYGGEEFAVVLPATNEAGAMAVAARIRASVKNLAIEHRANEWGVATVSIGVAAIMPATGATLEALLQAADRALYQAKNGGRNIACAASFSRLANEQPSNAA